MKNLAQQCLDRCDGSYEAYVYATINAEGVFNAYTWDVMSYPLFTFNDGSVLAFELEYEHVINCVCAFGFMDEAIEAWNLGDACTLDDSHERALVEMGLGR